MDDTREVLAAWCEEFAGSIAVLGDGDDDEIRKFRTIAGMLRFEWVPVNEAIVKNGDERMLWTIQNDIRRARHFDGDWECPNGDWILRRQITHVGPIPPPPEEPA